MFAYIGSVIGLALFTGFGGILLSGVVLQLKANGGVVANADERSGMTLLCALVCFGFGLMLICT